MQQRGNDALTRLLRTPQQVVCSTVQEMHRHRGRHTRLRSVGTKGSLQYCDTEVQRCLVSVAAEGKRVSAAAWEALHGAHRGGPELALPDACTVCLEAKLRGIAEAQEAGQVWIFLVIRFR